MCAFLYAFLHNSRDCVQPPMLVNHVLLDYEGCKDVLVCNFNGHMVSLYTKVKAFSLKC